MAPKDKPEDQGDGGEPAAAAETTEPKAGTREDSARQLEAASFLRSRGWTVNEPAGVSTPHQVSFGISEGTRQELEDRGEATDPFTGRKLTREDLPGGGS